DSGFVTPNQDTGPAPLDAGSSANDGGVVAADAGSVPCDGDAFRLDHPFAQIDGAQTIYVRSGATGDGSSAETPAGEFNAMPASDSPVVVLFAAAEAHTWNLQLDAITRPLALIGSCAEIVQLEAQGAPLIHQQGGELRLARLGLRGTAGDQALIEVSGAGSLSADHLSITTTGDSHGIHIEAGGDITLQHSHFAAIGGHALSGEQAVGSWTLEDNTFLGPIGLDGISIVDFGGSGFRMTGENTFQSITGTGLAVQRAQGSWTLEDNTFLGPIGADGISIVDFSGSGFRIADQNKFQDIKGAAVDVQNALGSWTLEDNTFLGPIGGDGISIVDFSGSGFRVAGVNTFEQIAGSGIVARDAVGSWTLEDNTFQGPVGLDGISVEGFRGDGLAITGNTMTGVERVGIRTVGGINTTISGNQITYSDTAAPGGPGLYGANFATADDTLALSGNRVEGSFEPGVYIDGNAANVEMNNNEFVNGRTREQGGDHPPLPPYGILVTASARVSATNNQLTGNSAGPLLVDLYDWSTPSDRTLSGEGTLRFAGNTQDGDTRVWHRPRGVSVISDTEVDDRSGRCPDAPEGVPCSPTPARLLPVPINRAPIDDVGCGDGVRVGAFWSGGSGDVCTSSSDCQNPRETCYLAGETGSCQGYGEECDDGNRRNGDGCSADCQIETERDHVTTAGWSLLFRGPWYEDVGGGTGTKIYSLMGQGPSMGGEIGRACNWNPGENECTGGEDPDLPNRLSDAGCSLFGNLVVKPGDRDEHCVDQEIIVSLHGGAFAAQYFAISQNQRVYGWGRNDEAQTIEAVGGAQPLGVAECSNGHGPLRECLTEPRLVSADLERGLQASAGGTHSCFYGWMADDIEPKIYCMGRATDAIGEEHGLSPIPLTAPSFPTTGPWRVLASGQNHNCALNERGEVWCWGRKDYGQLGDGQIRVASPPVFVLGPTNLAGEEEDYVRPTGYFTHLAVGQKHSCAIDTEGKLYCWGDGTYGAVGRRSDDSGSRPRRVLLFAQTQPGYDLRDAHFTDVACGEKHSCAVTSEGSVACFGANDNSALGACVEGDQNCPEGGAVFTWSEGMSGFVHAPRNERPYVSVTSGAKHTCAQDSVGQWFCWGSNGTGIIHPQNRRLTPAVSPPMPLPAPPPQ
ncbi:MAG: hypothetical protein CMH50_00430, partial [Myxococcales bacterium]|nr:hypothetical protein [Myxococcales bacterium]